MAAARSTLQNMNDTALRDLLRLHIVRDLITSDAISQRHGNEVSEKSYKSYVSSMN